MCINAIVRVCARPIITWQQNSQLAICVHLAEIQNASKYILMLVLEQMGEREREKKKISSQKLLIL